MIRYRATLAYDGSAYFGYQRQPDKPTVQQAVEQALSEILGQPTTVWAAGRTDTGVHATGQVIAFDADWKHADATLLRAINAKLPLDIALQDLVQHAGFHPRFDALSRMYRYLVAVVHVRQPLLLKRAWQMQEVLDVANMQCAAEYLIGVHDFAAFGHPPKGDNTVREVFRAVWHTEQLPVGYMLSFEVEATAFLHHMVRRLVGIQVAVGSGRLSLEEFSDILRSADLSRCKWIAPPQGLTLVKVSYPPSASSQLASQTQKEIVDGQ